MLFLNAYGYAQLRVRRKKPFVALLFLFFISCVLHGAREIELEAPVGIAGPYLVGRVIVLLFSLVFVGGSLIGAVQPGPDGQDERHTSIFLELMCAGVIGLIVGLTVAPAAVGSISPR